METAIHTPPRLLLGVTLLFWGAMTGSPLLALIAAILIEAANWIRLRWDFTQNATSRAWRLSIALTLITSTLILIDTDRHRALPSIVAWLPILFIPLQFVQSYGLHPNMALHHFSFFTRPTPTPPPDLQPDLDDSPIRFNFGNLYFILLIISASLGSHANQKTFLPLLTLLTGWLIFSRVGVRPLALLTILLLAGSLGLGGQISLKKLYKWATDRHLQGGYATANPTESKTNIGSLGQIKQSSDMLWRLKITPGSPPPALLRLSSYNDFRTIIWRNKYPPEINETLADTEGAFQSLTSLESETGQPTYLLPDQTPPSQQGKTSYSIRGSARTKDTFPLPGSFTSIRHIELEDIEINPLGTVRIFPEKSVIQGTVQWHENTSSEAPPWPALDLAIDPREKQTLDQIVTQLGLKNLPTLQAKTARISHWFNEEFNYTRHLTLGNPGTSPTSPLSLFLISGKRGHCEYFATAGTLLLRAAGIPARYSIGFAVMEKDTQRDEWILRGTHAHAWTRAWDAQQNTWIDFDPTPSSWIGAEIGDNPTTPWLADTLQRLKEDFALWRNRPENRHATTLIIWLLGLSVLTFIARRLWKSKLAISQPTQSPYFTDPITLTPLHTLEKPATRLLGQRPTGLTLTSWLKGLTTQNLPPETLHEALHIHQQLRFDPQPHDPSLQKRLTTLVHQLHPQIQQLKTPPEPPPSQNTHP